MNEFTLLVLFSSKSHFNSKLQHKRYGFHTLLFYIYCVFLVLFIVVPLRLISGNQIPPFMFVILMFTTPFLNVCIVHRKVFTHRDERTGEVIKHGLSLFIRYPHHLRFNTEIKTKMEMVYKHVKNCFLFVAFYPILGGIFFQSGVVVQACLVPVFFFLKMWYEYTADGVLTKSFGSDMYPPVAMFGAMFNEAVLSVMITNVKSPFVFAVLLLADVVENAFCFYSLLKTKMSVSGRIAPTKEVEENVETRKSLTKRSSSVYPLIQDLNRGSHSQGTALYIVAILLQRELVETLVPLQASIVISVLYKSGIRSNTLVSSWTSEKDYHNALMYLAIDFGIELVVFMCTVLILKRVYPEFSAWRILMGLLRSAGLFSLTNCYSVWFSVLFFQNTLSGIDLSLKFEWLGCNGENATWIGGFNWENC